MADQLVGDRITGNSLHYLGDQAAARVHIERMLGRYKTPVNRSRVVRFQFDQRMAACVTLARVLWQQGCADQAACEIEGNIEYAASVNHTLSLCNMLVQAACPIALLAGDFAAAERYLEMLRSHTTQHALNVWRAVALGESLAGLLGPLRSLAAESVGELTLLGLQGLGLGIEQPIVLEGAILAGRIGDGGKGLDTPVQSRLEIPALPMWFARDDERQEPPIGLAHDVATDDVSGRPGFTASVHRADA